jgi:hypothetical protein
MRYARELLKILPPAISGGREGNLAKIKVAA